MDRCFSRIWEFVSHGETLPLRIHLFRLLCIAIAALCVFLVIPANMLQDISPFLNPAVALYAAMVTGLYQISRRGVHFFKTLCLLTLLLLNISWLLNGGSTGSISYFYLTTLIIPLVLFSGSVRTIILAVIILNYAALILLEQHFPSMVVPFRSSDDRYLDLLTGFSVSVVINVLVFWVVVTGYDKKLKDHEKTEQELIASRSELEDHLFSLQTAQSELLQYRTLVEGSRDSIFIVDRELRLILVNQAFLNALEIGRDIVLNQPLKMFFTAEAVREFSIQVERCLATRKHVRFDMKYNNPLKGPRNLDISLSPIDGDGAAMFVACISRDATIKRTLEEQLRHTQRLDSIGQLAGGIAHDFNNILSVIGGYAYMAEIEYEDRQQDAAHIKAINAAVERASALTRGLLALSRKQDMELSQGDLNQIVLGAKSFISRLISEEIIFTVREAEQPLPVFVDLWEIQQVLINLATNARDAMPDGGRFEVSLSAAFLDREFIEENGFGTRGEFAMMQVSDTGCGMDEATCSKIFDPFFTTKEVGKGTGLGLAIAYGIIKQHHGFITVRSRPDSGTVFTIYIPIHQQSGTWQSPGEEKTGIASPRPGSELILLVDDDREILQLTESILSQYGYNTITACDGEQALELFEAHQDDIRLVITDVIMPKMNGGELADRLREIRQDVRVIFTSGHTMELLQNRGRLGKGVELLMKPLHPLQILKKIREQLDSQEPGGR